MAPGRKPSGYWSLVFAFALSLSAAAQEPGGGLGGKGQEDQQRQSNTEHYADEELGARQEPLAQSAARGEGSFSAIPYQLIGPTYAGYPECPYDTVEECDLLAQKAMAQSTWWMNAAAWSGLILSFVGLALIAKTMLYTKDAASYAKRAADAAEAAVVEAGKATKAARDTIDVTRDIGQAQVRAYITIETSRLFEVFDPDTTLHFEVKVKNSGQSPAMLVCAAIRRFADKVPFPGFPVDEEAEITDTPQEAHLTSGSSIEFYPTISLPEVGVEAVQLGGYGIYIECRVFGAKHGLRVVDAFRYVDGVPLIVRVSGFTEAY